MLVWRDGVAGTHRYAHQRLVMGYHGSRRGSQPGGNRAHRRRMPRLILLPAPQPSAAVALHYAGRLQVCVRTLYAEVRARKPVVPGKRVLIPPGPEKSQKKRARGDDVTDAAQQHLPRRWRI